MRPPTGGAPPGAGVALAAALLAATVPAGCAPAADDARPTGAATTSPTDAATTSSPTGSDAAPGGTTIEIDLDGRPFRLHLPPDHDAATPAPLLVGLHGYTSNASELDAYFGLTAAADARGLLLALPEGTTDGAYLAHRVACEHADQVTAIATLAGTLPADTSRCAPVGPVGVLHVHGDGTR